MGPEEVFLFRYSLALTSILTAKVHFPANTDISTYAHDIFLKILIKLKYNIYRKTPLLVPGVDHFSTAIYNKWETFVTKNKTEFETSFIPLLNKLLILDYLNLFLIEISFRKSLHPRY